MCMNSISVTCTLTLCGIELLHGGLDANPGTVNILYSTLSMEQSSVYIKSQACPTMFKHVSGTYIAFLVCQITFSVTVWIVIVVV